MQCVLRSTNIAVTVVGLNLQTCFLKPCLRMTLVHLGFCLEFDENDTKNQTESH